MHHKKLLKILHIGKFSLDFHGGIENFMAALMQQQCADGYQVSAIVHAHKKKQKFENINYNGLVIYQVPSYGQLAYAPISPTFGYYLNKVVAAENPDVIHIHLPNLSAFWCLFFARIKKIPWVIHWHADVVGSVPDFKIKLLYPFYRLFETALLKRARSVIATSPVYFESSEPLQRFKSKTVVVPLGLPDIQTAILNDVHGLQTEDEFVLKLLMVGRLTYYKGHKIIIEALAQLKQQGIVCRLSIVGCGELADKINNQIIKLGLTTQVKMYAQLSNDDLQQQLLITDLLCLPSIERTEAFGVVLLEAMRLSKPCLVTDVLGSGMSWVVKVGDTGYVVKANNVESLVKKIGYISHNKTSLKNLGEKGRKRFEQMFSIEKISQRIIELYNG